MSLAEEIERHGPVAHLVTVGDGGRPHVVAVRVRWEGDELAAGAGRHTAANMAARPGVTLLWPAPPGQAYSLIVDGTARVDGESARVRPTRAVLHRTPYGDPDEPSCVTVLARVDDPAG
jgi:hypothetical protein